MYGHIFVTQSGTYKVLQCLVQGGTRSGIGSDTGWYRVVQGGARFGTRSGVWSGTRCYKVWYRVVQGLVQGLV